MIGDICANCGHFICPDCRSLRTIPFDLEAVECLWCEYHCLSCHKTKMSVTRRNTEDWTDCATCGFLVCKNCAHKKPYLGYGVDPSYIRNDRQATFELVHFECKKCVYEYLRVEGWPDRLGKRYTVYTRKDALEFENTGARPAGTYDPVVCRICDQKQSHRFFTCPDKYCQEVVCRTCFSMSWLAFRERHPEWVRYAKWCPICVNKCCDCNAELRDRSDPYGIKKDVLSTNCWDCKNTLCVRCENWQILYNTGGARSRCCQNCKKIHESRERNRLTDTSITGSEGPMEIGRSTSSSEDAW